ncbi:hypothetical protein [Diaphorobacter caeni]|uniref:hypothetical protein n=1 Tax=Diaphorobacter caeni TaxID=2784387 RepID=UPI00188EF867|nr:hypothetical protein [Diaphorobacter caeni]MBF5006010.1 hypothetical protein [Diaphorobacter caeni]
MLANASDTIFFSPKEDGMVLNREFQLSVLRRYADVYPNRTFEKWHDLSDDEHTVAANLLYLQEHDLIAIAGQLGSSGDLIYQGGRITAKGMDFLADDGGLSAILGIVTIKLHDDTIKAIIESKIIQSDAPEPAKKRMIDRLRALDGEATKHLVLKLVDYGLGQGMKSIEMISSMLEKAS